MVEIIDCRGKKHLRNDSFLRMFFKFLGLNSSVVVIFIDFFDKWGWFLSNIANIVEGLFYGAREVFLVLFLFVG